MLPNGQQLAAMKAFWTQALQVSDFRLISAPKGSPNLHLAGYRAGADKPACFIKVIPKVRVRGFEQEKASNAVLKQLGFEDCELLADGCWQDSWYWLAFPWFDCAEVQLEQLSESDLFAMGQLIGQLHRRTTNVPMPTIRKFTLTGELNRQLAKLHDPEMLDRVTSRLNKLHRIWVTWDTYEQSLPFCFLHGDFGTRNIIRRKDNGRLQLIDFEHGAYGPCWLEMTKIREFELTEEAQWSVFEAGYLAEMGAIPPFSADYRAGMWLWQATGIFNYTSVHENPTFRQQGFELLRKFDDHYLR